jgi:hypothetical protein
MSHRTSYSLRRIGHRTSDSPPDKFPSLDRLCLWLALPLISYSLQDLLHPLRITHLPPLYNHGVHPPLTQHLHGQRVPLFPGYQFHLACGQLQLARLLECSPGKVMVGVFLGGGEGK